MTDVNTNRCKESMNCPQEPSSLRVRRGSEILLTTDSKGVSPRQLSVVSFKCLASGFPGSARVFIASLPRLSEFNKTPSPSSTLSVLQAPRLIIYS
jgi:hypothetical protein